MDGAAVLDGPREDIVAFRRARHALLMRITEMQEHDLAAENGYRSTRRLIEQLWRVDSGEAGRLIADATDLIPGTSMTGEPVPATLPATGEAAADGLVGEAHVRVVRRTMEHLGRVDGLDTETETVLVALADVHLVAELGGTEGAVSRGVRADRNAAMHIICTTGSTAARRSSRTSRFSAASIMA